jgi:hypothetical protein
VSVKRACKQCGLQVIVVEVIDPDTQQSRVTVLDPRAKVYHVVKGQDGPDLATKAAAHRVMAHHGALCKGGK